MIAAAAPHPQTLIVKRGTVRHDTAARKFAAGKPMSVVAPTDTRRRAAAPALDPLPGGFDR